MKGLFKKKLFFLLLHLMLLTAHLALAASTSRTEQTVGLFINETGAYDGYTLFNPIQYNLTYLINNEGNRIHSWESNYNPGLSVYVLENGNLLRTCNINQQYFNEGGKGGRVEEYDWDGNLLWFYEYSSQTVCLHHDIEMLPSGNILMIAWEEKTETEAIQAGRDPSLIPDGELWPDHIIEVEPDYDSGSGGTIVWEWHAWDHLIQDYDATKDNYGVVADHPELIDINYVASGPNSGKADWLHFNSVDYNAEFDQILISVRSFGEIWVIDHSTTTAEAAGHIGGNNEKGGDLLYRWGNPQTYDAGSITDQKLFVQHDARWIKSGYPGDGNITIFNNGQGRPGGNYSTVDEITPPVDSLGNYSITPGSAYDPTDFTWTYSAANPTDFYASQVSGVHRLENGNTLICDGPVGTFFEITSSSDTVWLYVNPVTGDGPLTQGDSIPEGIQGQENNVFRAHRYAADYPGFSGRDMTPGDPIELYADGDSTIVYVDGDNSSGTYDGTSWATAYQTIQEGIDIISDSGEIWVAQGTYYPTTGSDRTISIALKSGVDLYGGFAGTETERSQRDWASNETIISGNIGAVDDSTDNSYHVIAGADNCVIDGFTITDGYANGERSDRLGGAMYNYDCEPTLINCTFTGNYGEAGGAIYYIAIIEDVHPTPTIENCTFTNNQANNGGAILLRVGVDANITNCTFTNNFAQWRGGALFINYGASPTVDNCTFTSNSTNGNGGAVYTDDQASQIGGTYAIVQNSTFDGNTAVYRGGAMANYNSNNYPAVTSCFFQNNIANAGGGAIANNYSVQLTVTGCTFSNNVGGTGEDNIDSDDTCMVTYVSR